MRHILAATDLTPEADPALRLAARLAQDTGAALHVVHAMGLIGLTLSEAFGPLSGGLIPRAEAALEEQVRRTVPPTAGPESYALDYQDLPRAIATRRERNALDLVVLGDRRAGPGAEARLAEAARLGGGAATPILVPSEDASWPPARIQWLSLSGKMDEVEAWIGRLAPLATVVGGGEPPRGADPGADESTGGAPHLLVARGTNGDPVHRWIEEATTCRGLEAVSILLLPEEPEPVDPGGEGSRARPAARATVPG